jgi:hypothetical protein
VRGPRLKDIRTVKDVCDWELIWDMEVEEFAGDFWETVDSGTFGMPGSWVDDSSEWSDDDLWGSI